MTDETSLRFEDDVILLPTADLTVQIADTARIHQQLDIFCGGGDNQVTGQ